MVPRLLALITFLVVFAFLGSWTIPKDVQTGFLLSLSGAAFCSLIVFLLCWRCYRPDTPYSKTVDLPVQAVWTAVRNGLRNVRYEQETWRIGEEITRPAPGEPMLVPAEFRTTENDWAWWRQKYDRTLNLNSTVFLRAEIRPVDEDEHEDLTELRLMWDTHSSWSRLKADTVRQKTIECIEAELERWQQKRENGEF